ncbi:MAG: hypothetical protein Q4C09_06045 [Atopobiaceae bacterium]|nr:hypothetical protein [Atopobiaceae bacterium]
MMASFLRWLRIEDGHEKTPVLDLWGLEDKRDTVRLRCHLD